MAMPARIPRYSVDDLQHFPRDGNRYELIDGMLLETPAPGVAREVVISRLVAILVSAVQMPGHAFVFTHGAVTLPPGTQLASISARYSRVSRKQSFHCQQDALVMPAPSPAPAR
jgi:Uma2 family endonuclease